MGKQCSNKKLCSTLVMEVTMLGTNFLKGKRK